MKRGARKRKRTLVTEGVWRGLHLHRELQAERLQWWKHQE
jgi:hypothetical protein